MTMDIKTNDITINTENHKHIVFLENKIRILKHKLQIFQGIHKCNKTVFSAKPIKLYKTTD